jgi:hypothetical protein
LKTAEPTDKTTTKEWRAGRAYLEGASALTKMKDYDPILNAEAAQMQLAIHNEPDKNLMPKVPLAMVRDDRPIHASDMTVLDDESEVMMDLKNCNYEININLPLQMFHYFSAIRVNLRTLKVYQYKPILLRITVAADKPKAKKSKGK